MHDVHSLVDAAEGSLVAGEVHCILERKSVLLDNLFPAGDAMATNYRIADGSGNTTGQLSALLTKQLRPAPHAKKGADAGNKMAADPSIMYHTAWVVSTTDPDQAEGRAAAGTLQVVYHNQSGRHSTAAGTAAAAIAVMQAAPPAALQQLHMTTSGALISTTSICRSVHGPAGAVHAQTGLWGILRSIALEQRDVKCTAMDLEPIRASWGWTGPTFSFSAEPESRADSISNSTYDLASHAGMRSLVLRWSTRNSRWLK